MRSNWDHIQELIDHPEQWIGYYREYYVFIFFLPCDVDYIYDEEDLGYETDEREDKEKEKWERQVEENDPVTDEEEALDEELPYYPLNQPWPAFEAWLANQRAEEARLEAERHQAH